MYSNCTILEANTVRELNSCFLEIINRSPNALIFIVNRKEKSSWQVSLRMSRRGRQSNYCLIVDNVLKYSDSENLLSRLFDKSDSSENDALKCFVEKYKIVLINTDLIESTVIDELIDNEFKGYITFKDCHNIGSKPIYGDISYINGEMLSFLKVKVVTDLIYSKLSDEEKLIVELGADY